MSSSLLYTSLRRGTARMLVGALLLGVFPHHMFATDTTSTSTTASTVNSGVVTLTATTLSGGADAVSGKTLSMSLVMTGANAIERSFMTFGPLAGGTNSGATFSIAMGGLGGGVDEVKASSTSNSFSGTTASAMGADLTLNVGNTNISLSLGRSGAAVASGVVDAVNANTSSPYVASLVNSDQVRLTAKTTGTGGNAPVIATDTNYTATNGAYVVTWATLSGGVDEVKAQTDSLDLSGVITQSGADITVNIGGSEIILPPGATPNQAALSVAQSINNTGANAYTATASGAKLHLTAKAAGSAGNSSLQYKDLSYNTAPGIAAWVITDSLTGTTSQSGSDLALNVWGTAITLPTDATPQQVANAIATAVNGDSKNPYTATSINGFQVKFTAKNVGVEGNGILVASDVGYNAAPSANSTYLSSTFETASNGSGADLTVNILGHSITFRPGNSAKQMADAVVEAIKDDEASNFIAKSENGQVRFRAKTTGQAGQMDLQATDLSYNSVPATYASGLIGPFGATSSASGADRLLSIGGTTIRLGEKASPETVADTVMLTINADGGNPYSAKTESGVWVRLISKATGAAGNAPLIATDLSYEGTPYAASASGTGATGTNVKGVLALTGTVDGTQELITNAIQVSVDKNAIIPTARLTSAGGNLTLKRSKTAENKLTFASNTVLVGESVWDGKIESPVRMTLTNGNAAVVAGNRSARVIVTPAATLTLGGFGSEDEGTTLRLIDGKSLAGEATVQSGKAVFTLAMLWAFEIVRVGAAADGADIPSTTTVLNLLGNTATTNQTTTTTTPVKTTPTVRVPNTNANAQTTTTTATVQREALWDVEGSFAKDYIKRLAAQGVVSGYADGSFQPDRGMTRAEFLKVVLKALKVEIASGQKNAFVDITESWQADVAATAYALGIASGSAGKSGRLFRPNDGITRAEAAKMLLVAAGVDVNRTAGATNNVFDDVDESWQLSVANAARILGIASGERTTSAWNFRPNDGVTRAEAAKMVVKTAEKKESNVLLQ